MENVILPAIGTFADTLIGNAVGHDPLQYEEAVEGTILDAVFQFLPARILKQQKLNKSKSSTHEYDHYFA